MDPDHSRPRAGFAQSAIAAAAVVFLVFEALGADQTSDWRIFEIALADFHRGCECGPVVQAIDHLALHGGSDKAEAAASTLYGWMANFEPHCADTDMLRPDVVAEALYDRAEDMKALRPKDFGNLPGRDEAVAWETEAQKYLWFMAPANRGDAWAMSLVVRGYALSAMDLITAYTGREWAERYREAANRLRDARRPDYALTLGGKEFITSEEAWNGYKTAVLEQAEKDYRHRTTIRPRPSAGRPVRLLLEDHPLMRGTSSPQPARCSD